MRSSIRLKQEAAWRHEYQNNQAFSSAQVGKPSPLLHVLLKWLPDISGGSNLRVLDVACGIGRNGLPLAERGCEVYGTDLIRIALAKFSAESKRRNSSSKVHLCVHDMHTPFPFTNHSFDLVVDITSSINILSFPEFCDYFARLAMLCRKGGYLFLETFHETDEYVCWLLKNHRIGETVCDPRGRVLLRFHSKSETYKAAEMAGCLRLRHHELCLEEKTRMNMKFQSCYCCYLWERV